MARNRNGKQPRRFGPDTEDVLTAFNSIHDDFDVDADIHMYVALDGRLFVEATADLYVPAQGLISFSKGRFAGGSGDDILMAALKGLHGIYHEIDLVELRRLAKQK